ncbi:hypothetical protein OXX79_000243 [Metschnikowia pulcherrima]
MSSTEQGAQQKASNQEFSEDDSKGVLNPAEAIPSGEQPAKTECENHSVAESKAEICPQSTTTGQSESGDPTPIQIENKETRSTEIREQSVEEPASTETDSHVQTELIAETPQDLETAKGAENTVKTFVSGVSKSEEIESFSDDEIQIDDNGESSSESESESDASSSSSEASSSSDSESDEETDSSKPVPGLVDELEEEDEAITGPILSKNEVLDEKAKSLPADYTVPENAPLEYIGVITGLVENSAIIKANVSGEFRILKDDSILCFEDRSLLGPLFETFGRLQAPNYRVKFNTEEEFQKVKDKKGSKVFYVVPEAKFIYTDALKKLKGTDASNCHDEELPEEEQEYSDDEQELAAKQEKTRKRKQKKQENGEVVQKKKPAAPKAENNFVSYGFAPRKAETPSTSLNNQNAHPNHTSGLQGSSYVPSVQDSVPGYGAPYAPSQSTAYGQPLPHQGYHNQYQVHQPFPQSQAYTPGQQYGQYAQHNNVIYGQHNNAYGQPYNHVHLPQYQTQTPHQYQPMPYAQPSVQFVGPPNSMSPSHYGQPYQPQVLQQVSTPQLVANDGFQQAHGQPHGQSQSQPTSTNDTSNGALQQLQQMVSQNLSKEKQDESI